MTALIGQIPVSSEQPYVVYDGLRGLLSQHRTLSGAEFAAEKDRRESRRLGASSDASVYAWSSPHGWTNLEADWV